jgi:chemotaxis protein methyltransferase CheR
VAGCATGEEVYSLAMLLLEEGLYERARLYGTDVNPEMIRVAESGVVPSRLMERNRLNYLASGGQGLFSEAFEVNGENAVVVPSLRKNLVFSVHNLVTDGEFNEFQVVWCRNVLIYFDRLLQDRAHRLFHSSLARFGVLGLGRKESLDFTPCAEFYEAVNIREKLYRKVA